MSEIRLHISANERGQIVMGRTFWKGDDKPLNVVTSEYPQLDSYFYCMGAFDCPERIQATLRVIGRAA